METHTAAVEQHYGVGGILDAILAALPAVAEDPDNVAPAALAPVDEFHNRGREATLELAELAGFGAGQHIIDIGCGLGGSARHLAAERGCRVTGVDLTQEYVETATELARMVDLSEKTDFRQGNALALPFDDASFDGAWTEHVQMNIADKHAFFAEIARLIRPGGRLACHEILAGRSDDLAFPVPWAGEPALSHLAAETEMRHAAEQAGLRILAWQDTTAQSLNWAKNMAKRIKESGPPPLGLHLLMGSTAPVKLGNMIANMENERIRVVQAIMA